MPPLESLFDVSLRKGSYPYEKLSTVIVPSHLEPAVLVANEVAITIRNCGVAGKRCVLGLATGQTMVDVYRELVRLHKEEGLSFANVTTFNLDEYFPCTPEHPASYQRFMRRHLFDHVNLDPSCTHLPDGTTERACLPEHCQAYERRIKEAGGLDLQLLGIGRTGHIGFNEPGASPTSLTRLVTLHPVTLADNRRLVKGCEIPAQAITMGIGTILSSKRILLFAEGDHKSTVAKQAIEGEISSEIPATYLQNHPATVAVLDEAAGAGLTRTQAPWLLGPLHLQGLEWDGQMESRAVFRLSQQCGKSILLLTAEDYSRHGMEELLAKWGSVNPLNLKTFKLMQGMITGWPGGRPCADTGTVQPLRIVVFSPHPDDDVISMGGTLARLIQQGHEVHVAYMVSGANAVSKAFLRRQVDFLDQALRILDLNQSGCANVQLDESIQRELAAAIRRAEARSAVEKCGGIPANCHFLELPFYDRPGRVVAEDDRTAVSEFLNAVAPDQIYAAGDLRDPHGTHRICLKLLEETIGRLKTAGKEWVQRCEGWLYRGAWDDWPMHEVDRAIPLSPEDVILKRKAIQRHCSQKDETPFPGADPREFWQRAEDRNRAAALLFRDLGWAEYAAVETFARWSLLPAKQCIPP